MFCVAFPLQDSMELVFKQSKAVAVTSMSFPLGDVNNFVVGSEDGSVYMSCRHGRCVHKKPTSPVSVLDAAWKLRPFVRPTQNRVSNKYNPLTSQCYTNPTLDLPVFEVSLLPSHPVFLFRLSVVFVKVVQHKQGTHAGETNHFFPALFLFLECFSGQESLFTVSCPREN